jgi:hypothetical protein
MFGFRLEFFLFLLGGGAEMNFWDQKFLLGGGRDEFLGSKISITFEYTFPGGSS